MKVGAQGGPDGHAHLTVSCKPLILLLLLLFDVREMLCRSSRTFKAPAKGTAQHHQGPEGMFCSGLSAPCTALSLFL